MANLGSTSFKYRLFDMDGKSELMLAEGGYERVEDHGVAIDACLQSLVSEGHLNAAGEIDAVGFKTVLGKDLSGCVVADDRVIDALDGFAEVAPAHNPAYANGIRNFRKKLPGATLAALFETSFYQWVPESMGRYAVPESWEAIGVRRYGFHGASHKFIAERSAELLDRVDVVERVRDLYVKGPGEFTGKPLRVISCHLGGSGSICGIDSGVAIGCSMGFSPQSGLPQNNRVGDLDSMALPYVMKTLGISLEEAERQMSKESGLLGVSGVSNDVRDIREQADAGNERAQLALDMLASAVRHWIGVFMLELGGLDALVFTAGIGEKDTRLREKICAGLEEFGIKLDAEKNRNTRSEETDISVLEAPVRVLVIPTNEELVVARETRRLIENLNN